MAQVFYGCRLCYMQSISNLLSAAAKIRKKATKRIRMLKFALTKPKPEQQLPSESHKSPFAWQLGTEFATDFGGSHVIGI